MKFKLKILLFPLLLAVVITFYHCSEGKKPVEIQVVRGRTMGTFFTIKYFDRRETSQDAAEAKREMENGIYNVLKTVNRQMSTYIADSEISRFNRYGQNDWFEISADLAEVIANAQQVSQISGGAFDITVGPLVNLWGFGPELKPEKIPSDEKIKEVMGFTGYRKLAVRLSPPAVKKTQPEVFCDLAGIAKGYGVDKVAEYLEAQGIDDYLVEIGGEVRAKGKKEANSWWRLGIAAPDGSSGILKAFPLKNKAMATSGDYHNYFEEDGIRYSHTIDPGTGKSITHKLVSVTVVHASCMFADAMATAINVLGPEQGYELSLKEKLAVFLIIKGEGRFIEKKTPEFEKILEGEQ
ncbi:MAG: FAD:protein FMN transferase [Candidatus Aminicenantes bacterium]|nr:FAD:protein FMN transferase [Candidatus Aminicenantes bacterium]